MLVVMSRGSRGIVCTQRAEKRRQAVLCALELLTAQVKLMPLVLRVKVVSVDDVVTGSGC